jgi:hypothetical protein
MLDSKYNVVPYLSPNQITLLLQTCVCMHLYIMFILQSVHETTNYLQ